MASSKELFDAHGVILQSKYNFRTISQNHNESAETWSDYICRIAELIKKGKYREHGQS